MKQRIDNKRTLARISFFAALFIFVLVAFQNCNGTSFRSANQDSQSEKADNNGAGYGGKPKDYARFTVGFTCETRPSPVATIQVSNNVVTVTENKSDLCSAVQKNLDRTQIETSIYQQEIIGYQEGIFEGVVSPFAPMPASLVEVWCRDTNDQSGIETITHYDPSSRAAYNRTYFAAPDANGVLTNKMINDFSVARVVSDSKIAITNGTDFNLEVYRDQPAPMHLGLFIGKLDTRINGALHSRQTFCRLGGALDATVWPVKQIVDLNISSFQETTNLDYFAFSSGTGVSQANTQNLFISKIDGSGRFKVSNELSSANLSFQFNSLSKELYYATGSSTTPAMMRATFDGSSNNVVTGVDPNVQFKISGDGKGVAYLAYLGGGVGLKMFTPMDSGHFVLSPPVAPGTMGVSAFKYALNKVIFLCCNRPTQIYSANFDGTDLTASKTPALPVDWDFATDSLAVLNQKKAIWVRAWSWVGVAPSANYVIAIDGSWSQKLPQGWHLVSTDPLDMFGLLVNQKDFTQQALIDLRTGVVNTIPTLNFVIDSNIAKDGPRKIDSLIFTQNFASLVGLSNGSKEKVKQAIRISLTDQSVSKICPGVDASSITELPDGSLLIYGFDAKRKVLTAYLNTKGETCQQVNSLPLSISAVTSIEVSISKDFKNTLVNIKAIDLNRVNINSLIYMPLNGKPPYVINSPVYAGASIQKAIFLNDSKTVLFIGNQIRPAEQNAYLWSAK